MKVPVETLLKALRARENRYESVMKSLEDPEVFNNPSKVTALQKERGLLQSFHDLTLEFEATHRDLEGARELAAEDDEELKALAEADIGPLEEKLAEHCTRAEDLLLSDDGLSHRDVILEIRGGTGGEEAALFARDLYRMYSRYAEQRGWKVEVLDSSEAERGGFKEVIAQISGPMVYRYMRYESGGHRVQRVPETETQGRIHTSLATVAVLPKAEDVDISWKTEEVRVDTMRAGGP
ncbi:MAG: PCRF domain-containing protein, partial [Planctomycetota bacterium]